MFKTKILFALFLSTFYICAQEDIKPEEIFTDKGKKAILERLTAAEFFENFLDKKYTGTKRFGLEGGESFLQTLEQILKYGGKNGIEEVVLGMPHRGRLNVLANFYQFFHSSLAQKQFFHLL